MVSGTFGPARLEAGGSTSKTLKTTAGTTNEYCPEGWDHIACSIDNKISILTIRPMERSGLSINRCELPRERWRGASVLTHGHGGQWYSRCSLL